MSGLNAVFIHCQQLNLSKLKTKISKITSRFYTDNVVLTITNKRFIKLERMNCKKLLSLTVFSQNTNFTCDVRLFNKEGQVIPGCKFNSFILSFT